MMQESKRENEAQGKDVPNSEKPHQDGLRPFGRPIRQPESR